MRVIVAGGGIGGLLLRLRCVIKASTRWCWSSRRCWPTSAPASSRRQRGDRAARTGSRPGAGGGRQTQSDDYRDLRTGKGCSTGAAR